MRFRTIELSNPRFEHSNLRQLTFKSPALKGRGDVTLFVPPACANSVNLPLVLLLHGVYGSHWSWALSGGAHVTALKMISAGAIKPMVLAMPSDGLWGDGSGYVRHDHADYDSWIIDDVPAGIAEAIPQVSAASPLFISGLSMGGYGALRLGGKHASRVRGISAHSSITHFSQLKQFVEEPLERYGQLNAEEHAALYWLLNNRASLPPLRFDCGRDDPLIEPNRALHRDLLEQGVAHTYQEFAGGHSWEYWEEHLKDTLQFFNACLTAKI